MLVNVSLRSVVGQMIGTGCPFPSGIGQTGLSPALSGTVCCTILATKAVQCKAYPLQKCEIDANTITRADRDASGCGRHVACEKQS